MKIRAHSKWYRNITAGTFQLLIFRHHRPCERHINITAGIFETHFSKQDRVPTSIGRRSGIWVFAAERRVRDTRVLVRFRSIQPCGTFCSLDVDQALYPPFIPAGNKRYLLRPGIIGMRGSMVMPPVLHSPQKQKKNFQLLLNPGFGENHPHTRRGAIQSSFCLRSPY